MADQNDELARKLNELAGTTAALIAVVAQLPAVTPDVITAARAIIGSLAPAPFPGSPGGTAPQHSAVNALNRIGSISDSLAKIRASGGQ
jgi:hypothetical protein